MKGFLKTRETKAIWLIVPKSGLTTIKFILCVFSDWNGIVRYEIQQYS